MTTDNGRSPLRSARAASLTAATLAPLLCLPVPALAQGPGTLEEVIVTAQKREQNLQDVPVAVSQFSGEALQRSGVQDLFQLQTSAPSLIVNQEQSASNTAFGIRGVFTSSQNLGLESSVGLYVDGVYRARQGSMINNMVDIQSIEILRGPQGTLFGRNTPAGAVQINSVAPDHDNSGFLELTAGNYNLWNANGAASFSAIEDELAFRATGFVMQRDGYVDNVGLDADDLVNDRDRWGLRLQSLYTPNDRLTARLIIDRSETDEICCASGTWKNNLVAQDLPPGSPPKTGSDVRILELGGIVLDQDDFYDYRVSTSFAPTSSNRDEGVSLQLDWEATHFLLTSITSWRSFDSLDELDIDFSNVDGIRRSVDAQQNQLSQELRISDSGERLSYVAGLYYFEQDIDSRTRYLIGEDLTYLVGAFGEAFPSGTGALDVGSQEHSSYAAFGQIDYELSRDWVLTAGLRWTREDKDLANTFTEDASATLDFSSRGWGFWLFPPLAPRENVDETLEDEKTTGTLKLSWYASPETLLYASYGTGYKSGGMNTDRVNQALDIIFAPETSESFELGLKTEFPAQALRLNLALHATTTDDLQTVSFQGAGFALQNAGVAETWGGELDLSWQPTGSLRLGAAYAYTHGEYKDFEAGSCWVGTPWHTDQPDPGANGDGSCDRSGGMLSSNPEHALSLNAEQSLALTDTLRASLFLEYRFTDERMTDLNNDPEKLDGSYNLLNLRANLHFLTPDILLTVWGRNILEAEYTHTIADTVAQTGNYIASYNEPLMWGITVRKGF